MSWLAFQKVNRHPILTVFERRTTPPSVWPWSDDCPENYEHGKFMLTVGQLMDEQWETRRFHLWYMEAAKLGLKQFMIKVSAEHFHMAQDSHIIVDFHDMYRLLRRKDLDVAQVTIFTLMQAHVCRLINKEVIYLNPMLLTERTIAGYDIPDDSSALAKLNAKQRKKYRLDALIEYRYRASMYMLQAMKKIQGNGCILAAHQFGKGIMGHWIVFIIYPRDGWACIFDSLRDTNKEGYKEFEGCLRYGYKKYVQDPTTYDQRTEKDKKNGTRLKLRHQFLCFKQPPGSVLCGFYACEYLRTCSKYSNSARQLKKSQGCWRKTKVDQNFRRTTADICKFVTEAALAGQPFLLPVGELALDPKYDNISHWTDHNKFELKDYVLSSLDDL